MKRIIILIGILVITIGSVRADAYRDSLYSLVKCEFSVDHPKLVDNVDESDSLSLLQNEYAKSEMFMEYLIRAFEPFAKNRISGQSLYMLLRHCKERDENIEKENAYIIAKEQYEMAVEDFKQQNRGMTAIIVLSGYVSFLKRYYPLQAERLNDRMASPENFKAKTIEPIQTPVEEQQEVPQKTQPKQEWSVGDLLYFNATHESVPTPDKEDYLYLISEKKASSAKFIGEIKRINDEGQLSVNVYEKNGAKKGRLIATRNLTVSSLTLSLVGRQVDFYPSGKVKRVCLYNKANKVISVTEKDTLGNTVKTIEGLGANRKEKQYYNNGQLRKEKLGPGPKYTIHCFDKAGNPINYLEGDLYVFDDGVYVIAGTPPSYPGGIEAVSEYASSHVYIPESIRGRKGVYSTQCSIKIADDGSVMDDVQIVNSSGDPEFDAEAVAVLKSMPKWTPGKLKKWKYVQNPKNAKITVIRRRYVVTVSVII